MGLAVRELRARIRRIEVELGPEGQRQLELGMDLLDVCGRGRDQLVAQLRALREDLARHLVEDESQAGR